MTRRDEIMAAAVAALEAIAGVTVYGWKETPAVRADGTTIAVRRASDNPGGRQGEMQHREFNFAIEVTVRGAAPDVLCDAVLQQVPALLYASAALRALTVQLVEGPTTWETAGGDLDACVATLIYIAQYRTNSRSLT